MMNEQQVEVLCRDVLHRFPRHAEEFRQGKAVLGFLVGQAMRETAGRVTTKQATDVFLRLMQPVQPV